MWLNALMFLLGVAVGAAIVMLVNRVGRPAPESKNQTGYPSGGDNSEEAASTPRRLPAGRRKPFLTAWESRRLRQLKGRKRGSRFRYYASVGGPSGAVIHKSWPDCRAEVEGTTAHFQGFDQMDAAEAFLRDTPMLRMRPIQSGSPPGKRKHNCYAVATRRGWWVTTSWKECGQILSEIEPACLEKAPRPRWKGFRTERQAKEWARREQRKAEQWTLPG